MSTAGSQSFARLIRYDAHGVGRSDPIDSRSRRPLELVAVRRARGARRGRRRAGRAASPTRRSVHRRDRACGHATRTAIERLVLVNSAALTSGDEGYPDGHSPNSSSRTSSETNIDPDPTEWSSKAATTSRRSSPTLARRRRVPRLVDARRRDGARARRRRAPSSAATPVPTCVSGCRGSRRRPSCCTRTTIVRPARLGRVPRGEHPGRRCVELHDDGSSPCAGTSSDLFVDEIEEFLTGSARAVRGERVLATVLFTDIVDSTRRAAALGDRAWRAMLDAHDAIVRAELGRYGGREVNTTGDGFFGAFDGPTQAVRCGQCDRARRGDAKVSRCGPASTPASANGVATISPGSPCTSRLGSRRRPEPARCSCRGRSATSWPVPICASSTGASTS